MNGIVKPLMVSRNTTGFTLIEVTIVLAISSLLSILAFAGFSTLREQAQFTNAIDGLKEQVVSARTEAYTTVNATAGAGTDTNKVVLGRMLTFTPNSSDVIVEKITANVTALPIIVLPRTSDRTITVPWGSVYNGASILQVAFFRSVYDGSNVTAVSPIGGWSVGAINYATLNTSATTVNLQFKSASGKNATIDIATLDNTVERTFQ